MELEIKYTVHVDNQCVDDIMATALEGGITYWCDTVDVVGKYLGDYASDQISRGGVLRLHIDDEDCWHELTLEKFLSGLSKVIGERGLDVVYNGEVDAGEFDAEDADAIIQYALFGEIVYA